MIGFIKKIISKTVDWMLYTLLNEKQKKVISGLFSDSQKKLLKKLTRHGKKHAQKQKIKQWKHHLYNLGFTGRALSELETLYSTTDDAYMKQLAAWELALWHTNKYTKEGAQHALTYLPAVMEGESDPDQLRRAAIIKAECHEILHELKEGKKAIDDVLSVQQHPDLYLAAANLEESVKARTKWINKAMKAYNLQPVHFYSDDKAVEYDDLKTKPVDKGIENGPKVSVIVPAYNAQSGISTAIESILSQTWRNIELLVVDDCSSDHTKDVVRGYMKKDSRITLLSTPANSGPYVARNIALDAATGEFVTVNDSDDWSHAEKIAIQANHLKANKKVIANTSEHARLTEDLKFYRRGTPGRYIFSNMSSLMFRRKPVLKKLGHWDSVRFAADGEFKRRLIRVFGRARYVDLKTGPLSLPRQSAASLTGSSAFGYNGFFKGVRKEYVESLEFYHSQAATLYYPFPQMERPFPVPEPMWPSRENKQAGNRLFDVVIASDFRILDKNQTVLQDIKSLLASGKCVGLVQMYHYNLELNQDVSPLIRNLIDGNNLQMLVYGEKISTELLLIINPIVLEDWQQYIPEVLAENIHVIADQASDELDMEHCLKHMQSYVRGIGTWHYDYPEFQELVRDNVPTADQVGKKVSDHAGK